MTILELKNLYTIVCEEYISKFETKHGRKFTGWVADEMAEVATFIDEYYFNFSDIVYDIDTRQPKGKIFEWQNYNVNLGGSGKTVSYRAYSKGFRY